MSIGKTLDYKQNCDQFLKLLLKRVNFNACWIVKKQGALYQCVYSIPQGRDIAVEKTSVLEQLFSKVTSYQLFTYQKEFELICPIQIQQGELLLYNLFDQGYLFLYSKEACFNAKLGEQLLPVIEKFSKALKACDVFSDQQILLEKLKQSNQELNNYAHVVSHDLKSPIRNIETLISWLEEESSCSQQESTFNYFGRIRDNISKMERLISSILAYSSVGNTAQVITDIKTDSLISQIIDHIYVPSHIQIQLQESLPIIQGDQYRIQQLFQNLLVNAIKYNDKPSGKITVGYTEQEQYHQFFIQDNGIGIQAKYHQKIFEAFQTLQHSKDSSGIGLSIVKRIVDSYQGKVWLESTKGVGTTFFFTLKK